MILHSLDIHNYEIREASDRAGGRVYTHYFHPRNLNGNYYDVGAMRFPNIPIMSRTFDLFHRLQINQDLTPNPAQETLIPYYLNGPATPLLYNNIRAIQPDCQYPTTGWTLGTPATKIIEHRFVAQGPRAVMAPIYAYWREVLSNPLTFEAGWAELMELDARSVSLYYVTNWCETMTGSTGSFDGSFVSNVIHSLEFDWPAFPDNVIDDPVPADALHGDVAAEAGNVWRCVNGGSDVITRRILPLPAIDLHLFYSDKATKITYTPGAPTDEVMTVDFDHYGQHTSRTYTHVFNTTTLGCLQTIDTRDAGLDYAHREAIRVLRYEHAVKLGIKFSRRWWANVQGINRGGQGKTDRPTRVVVYPSYALNTPPDQPGVLLACYNSAQDAARLGSLFDNASALSHELVYSYVIADLAAMHDIPEVELRNLTESYHVYNWYGDPLTRGSWSAFGPGQYSSFYGRMQRPQAAGHLFFSGDSTSIYPGWIVGALNSAYRTVRQFLLVELWRAAENWELTMYYFHLLLRLEFLWGALEYEPQPELPEDINGFEGWNVFLGIIGAEAGL
ncbi:hypothetical protein L211DRAFT_896752 [Terfezia boudieri ATCC MYA-4762]|uniref:Amine oxidase domain-containing protein n=1 Tax=Terfezia boudieri ATCC MYA-4762 TaxID=1051890 RepID=A0A3N4LW82_9PEZI|nr:hypothetical protein L211DRAFT_896752 [Terfezia boudieri ATCC MYA-4762]